MKRLFLITMVFVATLGMAMTSCSGDEPEFPDQSETENPDESDDESPEDPSTPSEHKTLIAYYSYTNNVERIVTELRSQIDADVVEIEPAEKGLTMRRTTMLSEPLCSMPFAIIPAMLRHILPLMLSMSIWTNMIW